VELVQNAGKRIQTAVLFVLCHLSPWRFLFPVARYSLSNVFSATFVFTRLVSSAVVAMPYGYNKQFQVMLVSSQVIMASTPGRITYTDG
jgi:hypothetical protein